MCIMFGIICELGSTSIISSYATMTMVATPMHNQTKLIWQWQQWQWQWQTVTVTALRWQWSLHAMSSNLCLNDSVLNMWMRCVQAALISLLANYECDASHEFLATDAETWVMQTNTHVCTLLIINIENRIVHKHKRMIRGFISFFCLCEIDTLDPHTHSSFIHSFIQVSHSLIDVDDLVDVWLNWVSDVYQKWLKARWSSGSSCRIIVRDAETSTNSERSRTPILPAMISVQQVTRGIVINACKFKNEIKLVEERACEVNVVEQFDTHYYIPAWQTKER